MATLRGYEGRASEQRGITFLPVYVRNYARGADKLDRLRIQAEEGILTCASRGTLPLERAPEAHRLLESGGIRGRLVLVP